MTRIVLLGSMMMILFPSLGQDLEVTVNNIKNSNGVLVIGLFDSEKSFTKRPIKADKPKAQAGVLKVIFQNVPPGEYAISIFHDGNENGMLDSNFMGIPKEGFGFSNDAMGTFGPPTFGKAKFTFPKSPVISVTMKYF